MMETTKCTSCGEAVLSTDKFCKQCGNPIGQKPERKSENSAAPENPNKKYVLTFDALEQIMSHEVLYSIEVDDILLGKLKPGEKLETYIRKGTHSVTLRQKSLFFREKRLEILVENNQIISLMFDRVWGKIEYGIADPDTQQQQIEEMKEKDKKGKRITIAIYCIFLAIVLIGFFLSITT